MLLRILFALASVVGASATSLTYVSTRAALVMDDMRRRKPMVFDYWFVLLV